MSKSVKTYLGEIVDEYCFMEENPPFQTYRKVEYGDGTELLETITSEEYSFWYAKQKW